MAKNLSPSLRRAPTSILRAQLKRIAPWQAFIGVLALILGAFFGAESWVQKVARDAILDERFLATLASRVRPVCIFDSHGAIEADLGAMEYIEDIKVNPVPKNFGFEVVIKAKRHLAYAPVVSGLDIGVYPQTSTRGKLHEWTITLTPESTASVRIVSEDMDTAKLHRFKLEILH